MEELLGFKLNLHSIKNEEMMNDIIRMQQPDYYSSAPPNPADARKLEDIKERNKKLQEDGNNAREEAEAFVTKIKAEGLNRRKKQRLNESIVKS